MRQHAILVAAALLVGSLASAEDPTSRDNTNAPKELQNTTPNKAPANLPRIEMVRVKPSDSAGSEYPLSSPRPARPPNFFGRRRDEFELTKTR